MSKTPAHIAQMHERCVVNVDEFDAWLAERGWAWQALARGEYGVSIDDAQYLFVASDPVRWCNAFMDEPDTGDPYTFFDYQIPSVRAWDQNVVHRDGAEVGKTREIIAILLWGMATAFGFTKKKPSCLVAAPQQTHLDEIIMAIEAHVGENESATGRKPFINRFWLKPKKHPHYMMRFRSPNTPANQMGVVYFRPFGHDGEALRGVHVNALGIVDEAAKVKGKKAWGEFPRALMPGCYQRVYSVHDGDNQTAYHRLTREAIPNLEKGKPGMRLFVWPKTLMPHPFWSDERKRELIQRFGGENTPEYQRNVLAMEGQQENSVWPIELLEKNIRDVPEYRTLKLFVNAAENELHIICYAVQLHVEHGKKSAEQILIEDRYEQLDEYQNTATRRGAFRALLREFFEPVGQATLWAGADLGFSNDPTEVFLCKENGAQLRDVLRVHLRGVEYWMQQEVIYCLDELFSFQAQWGIDMGAAGVSVIGNLQNLDDYAAGEYSERILGVQFASVHDAVDEDGNVVEEVNKDGDVVAVRLPAKELATNLITTRLQNQTWAMPYDDDVIGHFSNHTAREGTKHRIFSKQDDHTIDAKRTLILAKALREDMGGGDAFSTGAHRRAA